MAADARGAAQLAVALSDGGDEHELRLSALGDARRDARHPLDARVAHMTPLEDGRLLLGWVGWPTFLGVLPSYVINYSFVWFYEHYQIS